MRKFEDIWKGNNGASGLWHGQCQCHILILFHSNHPISSRFGTNKHFLSLHKPYFRARNFLVCFFLLMETLKKKLLQNNVIEKISRYLKYIAYLSWIYTLVIIETVLIIYFWLFTVTLAEIWHDKKGCANITFWNKQDLIHFLIIARMEHIFMLCRLKFGVLSHLTEDLLYISHF